MYACVVLRRRTLNLLDNADSNSSNKQGVEN